MFPIDPGADATLGGMAATRASGTTAVRYGTMRDNVLGLTVVLADGRVIQTGGRARKSSSGYDLTRLFVGSEGTLGVITELTLRLYGRPEAVRAAVCPFAVDGRRGEDGDHDDSARHPGGADRDHRRSAARSVVNRYSKTDYPLAPTLFFEFHGTSEAASRIRSAPSRRSPREHGAHGLQVGVVARGPRHALAGAAQRLLRDGGARGPARAPGPRTSACRSRTSPSASSRRRPTCRQANVVAPLVGHAGDGNFHLIIMLDPDDRAGVRRRQARSTSGWSSAR